jgi:hypothetical protein
VSFLIDPPWLYASGRVAAKLPEPVQTPLTVGTTATFLIISIGLYLNAPFTRWLWRACKAQDGRDWMLNSGVLHFDHQHAGPRTHAASALLFATYPVWMWLGLKHGRR